jgi:uncharacterized protein (DUF1330 family)
MVAYVVVDVDVYDPVVFEEYRQLGVPTLGRYGARVLARSEAAEPLEGDWRPRRFVILEFESVAKAKEWHASPDYARAKVIRQRSAETNSIVVQGL